MRHGNPIMTVLAVALFGGAVAVRAIEPTPPVEPVVVEEELEILEPMQLLRAGGTERMAELDPFVPLERRVAFVDNRLDLLDLAGCPPLDEWMRRREGLAIEQSIASLTRSGTRVEALAALALTLQLARRTEWDPGMFGGSQGPELLGGLLGNWLNAWGEAAATDPLLYEPALAAALAYGHVMALATDGNLFGGSDASRERARSLLRRLMGDSGERRTAFGIAFQSRHPSALTRLENEGTLAGFTREVELFLPELDGECGG